MPLASANLFPSMLYVEGTTPASPSSGQQKLFVRSSDHVLCMVNSGGTVTALSGALTNPMSAVGDVIQGGAAGAPARLAASATVGQFLMGNGTTTSLTWASRELDYVEKTSSTSVTATTEGTANTVVTGSAIAYDGSTIIMVEFFCPFVNPVATANANIQFFLYDGSSSIGQIVVVGTPATNTHYAPAYGVRRLTPSNASHTYSIRGCVSSGTGSANAGAGGNGATMPAFIRITRAV